MSIHSSSSFECYNDTELTLGLPGTKIGTKRAFSHTLDLHLATSTSTSHHRYSPKEHVVGWPPVRASRKSISMKNSCKYVKVAVDGAPYLRKINLEIYDGYDHLLRDLYTMFGTNCFIIRSHLMNEKKFMESRNIGIEYMPTYEDKDGDWMLLGDVPWKMFIESCKRIRLMISSEDNDFGSRTTSSSNCMGSSEKKN